MSSQEILRQFQVEARRPMDWDRDNSDDEVKFSNSLACLVRYAPPEAWPVRRMLEELNRPGRMPMLLRACFVAPDKFRLVYTDQYGPVVMSAGIRDLRDPCQDGGQG